MTLRGPLTNLEVRFIRTIDRGGAGYNTDGIGAVRALEEGGITVEGTTVLLLGAGGAAKAIAAQLILDGARVLIANRTARIC